MRASRLRNWGWRLVNWYSRNEGVCLLGGVVSPAQYVLCALRHAFRSGTRSLYTTHDVNLISLIRVLYDN